MAILEAIEDQVRALSPREFAEFRRWFTEFDAVAWDEQLARDAEAGKLDELADAALNEHRNGTTTEL